MAGIEVVRTAWREIDAWLEKHAPQIFESMHDGAEQSQLDRFKKDTGIVLPEDLLESYRMHDGQGSHDNAAGLFDGWYYAPFSTLYEEWRRQENLDDELSDFELRGPLKRRYYSKLNVPFALDHGGNYLGLDLDPGAGGHVGQIINYGGDELVRYVLAPSLASFLSSFAEDLRHGRYQVEEQDGAQYLNREQNLIEYYGELNFKKGA